MEDFPERVKNELIRARAIHGDMRSLHEAYATILEEMDEFWDEVKLKPKERSKDRLLEEIVQIAAMCQRAAEDCGLMDRFIGERKAE